jgi:hypothetical protein
MTGHERERRTGGRFQNRHIGRLNDASSADLVVQNGIGRCHDDTIAAANVSQAAEKGIAMAGQPCADRISSELWCMLPAPTVNRRFR